MNNDLGRTYGIERKCFALIFKSIPLGDVPGMRNRREEPAKLISNLGKKTKDLEIL